MFEIILNKKFLNFIVFVKQDIKQNALILIISTSQN